MQSKDARERLSRLRKSLAELVSELRGLTHVLAARQPMVKGTVYRLERKCGKPNCRCATGEAHVSTVLSWSERGRTRLVSVPDKRLNELRRLSEHYQRFRKARARLVQLHKSMLDVVNRIEEERRREP